ncbi:MAG: hypothetical protein JST00_45805 [Deltaproteobacteria bacterium]|nr:hypothetical protein [Deltaproteobacteria bacterium]
MALRKLLASLLTVAFVSALAPAARADLLDVPSPLGPADGEVPTAKKVIVATTMSGMIVSFALSFVFLAQSSSSEKEREDILRSNGGITDGSDAQCVTVAQCNRVADLKQDREDAKGRWEGAMIAGSAFAAVSLATMLLWPNAEKEKKHGGLDIKPQATGTTGGGLLMSGSF